MENKHVPPSSPQNAANSDGSLRAPMTILGRTGLSVSRLAFGAGPVSGLMTGDNEGAQRAVVEALLAHGINWIDTAAGYGNGRSEANVGRALRHLSPRDSSSIHIATKVRIDPSSQQSIDDQVRQSLEQSLHRLGRSRVTLLQLHNGITKQRGDEPASVAVDDVLGSGGVAEAFQSVQLAGLTDFCGLTGTGTADCLRTVISSGEFDTIQLPYNLLNPSAGCVMPESFGDRNYGNILADCLEKNLGVFAIRVFAAGALLNQPPSAHTLRTPYFPLSLYERDMQQASELRQTLGLQDLTAPALHFALSHPAIHTALLGFASAAHVAEAVAFA